MSPDPRCPACGDPVAERDMVLCGLCGVVTHAECYARHEPNCRPAQARDQARLAAWKKAVRG